MNESTGMLASVQMSPVLGEVDENLDNMEQALQALPPAENRLVVFPEMATTGYFFPDRGQLCRYAEPVPDGPSIQRLISLAQRFHAYLVVGLPELSEQSVYNSSVLVGPEGFLGKYRKLHLWSEEKDLFDPGDLGLVLIDLPFARVGMMICYDLWFPEQARILGLLGADVLTIPAALVWNDTPAHRRHGYYMVDYVGMATAHLNRVHVALASQVGRSNGMWMFGSSFVADAYGWLLTEPAGDEEPQIISASVDFHTGRRLRGWGKLDDFDQDRRTDVYGALLGYQGK